MFFIIIGLSLLFFALGYMLTEQNAKYLLAGYNLRTEVEREKVDIKSYLGFFKRFHLFLGLSFLVIGLYLHFFSSEKAVGAFVVGYPIVAYAVLILRGNRYYRS
jgi:hypothetical protein